MAEHSRGHKSAGPAVRPALPLSRADLHVHTNASIFKYFKAANSHDSYNDPEEVYRLARARGMDFVTFSDHDTVEGMNPTNPMNPMNPNNPVTWKNCTLPSTVPSSKIDEGLCAHCRQFKGKEDLERQRKEYEIRFQKLIDEHKSKDSHSPYDILAAYSGGKDSTLTLDLLKNRYNLRVLAMTFDHGFVSPFAFAISERLSKPWALATLHSNPILT